MSLDLYLVETSPHEVAGHNITHNLTDMAEEAGIYRLLWRPKKGQLASDMIEPLKRAIAEMEANPERFTRHDSPNGWGLYENFLPWLREVLASCEKYPNAEVRASV